jgi:peptidoglycan/xylan/chitin deacetylase (PgdA/CDA1 family)
LRQSVVTVSDVKRSVAASLAVASAVVAVVGVNVVTRGPQQAVPLAVEVPAPPEPPAPEVTAPAPPPAPLGVLLNHGPRDAARVAITFNTAYSPELSWLAQTGAFPRQYNPAVLDAMVAQDAPATVFVTGVWAAEHPDAMARLAADERFEIGNLTQNHRGWTFDCFGLPPVGDEANQRAEITASAEQIAALTGQSPTLLRFPGLCAPDQGAALAAQLQHTAVGTDVTFNDSFVADPVAATQAIIDQVQAGSIIVLHLNGAPNAPATTEMINILVPQLRERGLEPVTVSELLSLN